jgi:phage terminase small subunit
MLFSEGVNGTQAYLQAYRCKENSAQVGASRLRRRPEISAAIEAEAKSRLASMLPKAVGRLDQLIDATSEKVSLEAVKATLDRTGVPSQRSDRAGSGNGLAVTINIRSGHAGQRDEVITITAPQQDE